MIQPNPLSVLELTPFIVRLLRKKPERLIKIAETHKRWMLGELHPEANIGRDNKQELEVIAKQISAAIDILKNAVQREKAIDEFLARADAHHSPLARELQKVRADLKEEQRVRGEEKRKSHTQCELLKHALAKSATALVAWLGDSMLPRDSMEIYNGVKKEVVSVAGTLFITGLPDSRYVSCRLIGPGRLVYRETEQERSKALQYSQRDHQVIANQNRASLLLGSFYGSKTGWGDWGCTIIFPPEKLQELAFEVRPYLEIGKPLVIFREERGEKCIYITTPLEEVKRGFFKAFHTTRWFPVETEKA